MDRQLDGQPTLQSESMSNESLLAAASATKKKKRKTRTKLPRLFGQMHFQISQVAL